MKNTYAPYCRNHDEVIKALESFGENEEISEFLNQKVEKMKEQMNLFDVSSLLIKPVQRILKYPLLLNELLQVQPFPWETNLLDFLSNFSEG